MWSFSKKLEKVIFTNTLSGKKEEFVPLKKGRATLYSCGPTVYGPVQIGNLRSFVLADLVARTLSAAGYTVDRVMNITDVGHLVADAELGEDKMAAGAKREGTTPEEIAKRYTQRFLEDISALNIDISSMRFPRATSYIKEQIKMVRELERKGYTYTTHDGVYFDTTKFKNYGELVGRKNADIEAGVRVDLGEKHSPHDFVLWRTAKPNDLQKWNSPWGQGNPGWSIECSAMATSLLGNTVDIHTGGEDLASIHHNNEIAQSECATGQHPFVKYWVHGAFLTADGEKLSKSAGNSFTLTDIKEKGFHPLALRYLFLQAHYRSPLSFTFESLSSAQTALEQLWKIARNLRHSPKARGPRDLILAPVFDDLGTPQVLAGLYTFLNSNAPDAQKWEALSAAEEVLGLSLTNPPEEVKPLTFSELPENLKELAQNREEARKNKEYVKADELRINIEKRGYRVEDSPSGPLFTPLEK